MNRLECSWNSVLAAKMDLQLFAQTKVFIWKIKLTIRLSVYSCKHLFSKNTTFEKKKTILWEFEMNKQRN